MLGDFQICISVPITLDIPEAYSEPQSKISKMKLFVKIFNGFSSITIFTKCSIIDV